MKVTLERDFSIIANRGGQFSNGVVAHKDYLNDGPMYLRAAIRSDFIGIIANISNAWKEEYDMDKFKDKHGWGEGRNYFLEKIAQRKGKE